MAKAINEKDLRLLKVCEITKEYKILMDIVYNYPEIQKEDLGSISEEYIRFFENIYPRVRIQALSEWTGSLEKDIKKFSEKDNKRCYICNHPLVYVCTIHNKFNGKSIDIGRECNKHFGIYSEKEIDTILENKRRLNRLDKLDSKYPNLLTKINNWKEIINREEVYIFGSIKDRYLEVGERLIDLHKEYTTVKKISLAREEQILDEIQILLIEEEREKREINKFIKKSKSSVLYPTKKMMNSLKGKRDYNGIRWLEEDGRIKTRTLHRFRDEHFCRRLINNFNEILSIKGVTIYDFHRHKECLGYSIIINKKEECKLFYSYESMCLLIGDIITQESKEVEEFTYKDIILDSILVDEYSIEWGLQIFGDKLMSRGIELEEYFHNYQDILWKVRKSDDSDKAKYYYHTKIKGILDVLKELIYGINNYDGKKIFNLLADNSKGISNGEAYELIKLRNK